MVTKVIGISQHSPQRRSCVCSLFLQICVPGNFWKFQWKLVKSCCYAERGRMWRMAECGLSSLLEQQALSRTALDPGRHLSVRPATVVSRTPPCRQQRPACRGGRSWTSTWCRGGRSWRWRPAGVRRRTVAAEKPLTAEHQVSWTERETADELPSLKTQMSLSEKICALGCVGSRWVAWYLCLPCFRRGQKTRTIHNPHSPAAWKSALIKAFSLTMQLGCNLDKTFTNVCWKPDCHN